MAAGLYKYQKNIKHSVTYSDVHNNVNINFRKISPYTQMNVDVITLDITPENHSFHQKFTLGIAINKSIFNKLVFNTLRNTHTVRGIVTTAIQRNPKFLKTKKFYYYVLKESL